MKKFVKKILIFIYHIMARIFPLSMNKVMFMSNMGRNYSGNTRAIYEDMLKDARFDKKKKFLSTFVMLIGVLFIAFA